MKPGITRNLVSIASHPDNWYPDFPNPADFRFDYFKLLKNAPEGLASISETKKVAVVGAGAAGMTVARELHRCGFEVTIFEASNRIGGRLYTVENPLGVTQAGMEMGAMRMPFFGKESDPDTPEYSRDSTNCILSYYLNYEAGNKNMGAILSDFPNPGQTSGGTGIYMNDGLGPLKKPNGDPIVPPPTEPELISWPKGKTPQNPTLRDLSAQTDNFGDVMGAVTSLYYTKDSNDWEICWGKIVDFYNKYTFNDLVMLEAISPDDAKESASKLETFDGNLGGFGMEEWQADLLYTIGVGDGSWGAFYNISALWFMRCTYFGFSSHLQTVEGLANARSLPVYEQVQYDARGEALPLANFEGIQSLVEYLYYVPAPGSEKSLHDSDTAHLYINNPVNRITKNEEGVLIKSEHDPVGEQFDMAVVTTTQWASQMSIDMDEFPLTELPMSKINAERTQHNISSCKLFFPLKEKYWEKADNKIPQIIVTDSFVQDVYSLSWDMEVTDHGVILASYTWEDDSLKLLPFNQAELTKMVVEKLAQISVSTTGQNIADYIDDTKPVSIQWINEPTYIGCAKLYRAYNQDENELDLAYNQYFAGSSNLYFAGENYSVEGGWTEPALRSGIDCVMRMLHNIGADFKVDDFNYEENYPSWPKPTYEG